MSRALDVRVLAAFITARKKQDQATTGTRIIDPIAWPVIEPQLPDSLAQWFTVAEPTRLKPTDASDDAGLRPVVAQALQPRLKHIAAIPGQVVCYPKHREIVTYLLRVDNPEISGAEDG
jgi:hypothetical protein